MCLHVSRSTISFLRLKISNRHCHLQKFELNFDMDFCQSLNLLISRRMMFGNCDNGSFKDHMDACAKFKCFFSLIGDSFAC